MAKKPAINKEIEDMGAFRSEPEEKQVDEFENQNDFGNEADSFDGADEDTFTPDFGDTHDEVVLEDGSEVMLRIIGVESGVGPKGPYKRIRYEIEDEPYAKEISNIISMPNQNDDARRRNKKNLRLRDFMSAHGLSLDRPFNWNDLLGVEVWAILGVEESDQYGDKNTIKKYTRGA